MSRCHAHGLQAVFPPQRLAESREPSECDSRIVFVQELRLDIRSPVEHPYAAHQSHTPAQYPQKHVISIGKVEDHGKASGDGRPERLAEER